MFLNRTWEDENCESLHAFFELNAQVWFAGMRECIWPLC